jgi:hypothetical protein
MRLRTYFASGVAAAPGADRRSYKGRSAVACSNSRASVSGGLACGRAVVAEGFETSIESTTDGAGRSRMAACARRTERLPAEAGAVSGARSHVTNPAIVARAAAVSTISVLNFMRVSVPWTSGQF